MKFNSRAVLAVFGLVCGTVGHAQTVVISNLSSTRSSQVSISATAYQAAPFTTDSSSSYSLNSVTLGMAAATNAGGSFFVAIYSGATQPTALVTNGQLSGNSNPATAGNYSFTAGASVLLAPSTTYWVVAGVTSGVGVYKWQINTTDAFSTSTWLQVPDGFGHSVNAGVSWSTGTTTTPQVFELSATAIPEPSTYVALFGLTALSFAAYRKRHSKAV
jgi:hypothetical protein